MARTRRELLTRGAAVVAVATLAGCLGGDDGGSDDDHSDDHDHDDHDHDEFFDEIGIYELQLLDRAHDPHEEISNMHGDHWHASGDFPTVPLGDNLSIGVRAYDEDDTELELWDEYELTVAAAPGADETLLSFDSHGDHVHIHGEAEGLTEIVFGLSHDGHAEYQSAPLAVVVSEVEEETHDHAFDAHHVADVSILDRALDPHEEVAEWHDGHWHGDLPPVPIDDNVSLGAVFVDEDDNEAELTTEYTLRVRLAEGAPEIVEFDFHGDHVHIIGLESGDTEVVFQLWHDDHADFETDPLAVSVGQ